MARLFVLLALGVVLAACAAAEVSGSASPSAADPTPVPVQGGDATASSGAAPSPAFALNEGPATLGCDAIGVDYTSVTWRIDPSAQDAVTAVTDIGTTLRTYWAPGFTAGGEGELVVRAPDGTVVVEDGDQLKVGDWLHGYFVCLGAEKLYVLSQPPQ